MGIKSKVKKVIEPTLEYYVMRDNEHFITYTASFLDRTPVFDEMAEELSENFCSLVRRLVNHKMHGTKIDKPELSKHYNVKSRVYNLAEKTAFAMIDSARECKQLHAELLEDKLEQAMSSYMNDAFRCVLNKNKKQVKKLKVILENRKRKIWNLENEIENFSSEPSVFVFGKDVYYEQHKYADKKVWEQDYANARNCMFGARGSSDETSGNSTYQIHFDKVELKKSLFCSTEVYRVFWFNVFNSKKLLGRFCLNEKEGEPLRDISLINNKTFDKKLAVQPSRTPLKVFFMRKGNAWNIYVSYEMTRVPAPNITLGSLGVDINNGHLEASAIHLNNKELIIDNYRKFSYDTKCDKNKRAEQIYSAIRDMVAWAKEINYSIVLEYLDFEGSKRFLKNKLGALLHVLPYRKILKKFERECCEQGVRLIYVRSHYTSLLGNLVATQFSQLSRDVAASVVIGLRGLEGGNFWLNRLCLEFKKQMTLLRINCKRNFGRHVLVVRDEKGTFSVEGKPFVECDTLGVLPTKSYLYSLQERVGDEIKTIMEATRKHLKRAKSCKKRSLVCRVLLGNDKLSTA